MKLKRKILIRICLAVIIIAGLIFIFKEKGKPIVRNEETATESIGRVIEDGKKALRSAAETANDAAY